MSFLTLTAGALPFGFVLSLAARLAELLAAPLFLVDFVFFADGCPLEESSLVIVRMLFSRKIRTLLPLNLGAIASLSLM